MADVNTEYDRIHYELVNGELVTHDNIVIEESLSEDDDRLLASQGYLLRRIDDQNYWIISARLDDVGMTVGIEAMYAFARTL